MSARRRRPAAAGFTLLETLVALAILGIVLTTVFAVIGSGLRAAHRDEDRLLLGLVAQNLLVRSRLDLTTADGPRSGDIGGGLVWRIESEPYAVPEDILPPPPDPDANRGLGSRDGKGDATDTTGDAEPYGGNSSSFGGDRTDRQQSESSGAGSSSFGSDRADRQQPDPGGAAGIGDRPGMGDSGTGEERRGRPEPKEEVRLRLVRVIVEKGGQRFELTGLATEPRRERPGRL